MQRNDERPDVRFWTSYDYFMVEREARALRGKHVRDSILAYVRRTKAQIAQSLKHAGAQPLKPQRGPA